MDKILAIIPARGGSKGVPKKNIKQLNGKPLISYTIEAAKKCKLIDRVVVSTDDLEIAEISREFGAEIPYLRPNDIAGDKSPTIDCIIHMLNYLNENEKYIPDYVMLLQCTSPLRNSKHVEESVNRLIDSRKDAIVSICEAEVNPYWSNVFNGDNLEYFIKEGKYITRRQDLPKVYRLNGAIYIIKTEILLSEKTFEPESLTGYIMDDISSVDIDTAMDFKIAEIIMKEREEF